MKFYESLGEVIREERIRRGYSLRQISQRGYVSMGHLSDVENGRKEGSSAFIEAVAGALGIPTYELIIEAGYRMAEIKIPETYQEFMDNNISLEPSAF